MKLVLLELPGGRYRFVFVYHHLLMDGWSEGILFDELESGVHWNGFEDSLQLCDQRAIQVWIV